MHLNIVLPGIESGAVTIRRDIEIAALVDQQPAVDTEQAFGGFRA
jgi:hypothetical protein